MALRSDLSTWKLTPFESNDHMVEAMQDPQYRRSPEFVAAVEAKVALMAGGITPVVHNDHARIVVGTGVIGNATSAAGRSEAAERKSAEQQLADIYGPGSVRLESRAKSQQAAIEAANAANPNKGNGLTRVSVRTSGDDGLEG
jgi:hypothetical protein